MAEADEGWAQGELETSQAILRGLLEKRFGMLPETLARQIDTVQSVERLRRAILGVFELQKLDDLQL
jgi:hypothetical protein